MFKKTLTAALAAATLSGAVVASAAPAEAGWGRRHGGAVAAGVIGGIALGAVIASHRPVYAYDTVYEVRPAYRPACTVMIRGEYDAYGQYFERHVKVCR